MTSVLRTVPGDGGGHDVPCTIENVPCTDPFGRETVSSVRTFPLPGTAQLPASEPHFLRIRVRAAHPCLGLRPRPVREEARA